jgi:CDP-glucose 4,6-dehydratase
VAEREGPLEGVEAMSIYAGRRVFVTGHTGFKGSWLALWLQKLGAQVHGYALVPPTTPNLFDDAGVEKGLAGHVIGDIRDYDKLKGAMKAARPEIVFHMAAQPLVRLSYRTPRETFETNVQGTVNVLEAVREVGGGGVKVCQVITSDKCYENREWVFSYRENDPMGGFDPYSASKGCAELVVAAYRRSFFHPEKVTEHGTSLSSVRAGNVIGGGDWAEDRIVPDCVRALEKGESILVRNPRAIRPWQHVLEPLSGYLTLAARQWEPGGAAELADAFNFGPTSAANVTVRQIVERAVAGWGSGKWHTPETAGAAPASAVHEATFLKLDITKAMNVLKWKPAWSVEQAVDQTVSWYRARARGEFDARAMCLKQIEDYERVAGLEFFKSEG